MRFVSGLFASLCLSASLAASAFADPAPVPPPPPPPALPAPSEEALAAARQLEATASIWAERPGVREFMAQFPHYALQHGLDAEVELICLVADDHRIACRVLDVTPIGPEFAEAAIALSGYYRVSERLENGEPTRGGKLFWTVYFNSTGRPALGGEIRPGIARRAH
jgi:alkanesulfonate monooxygenase SsuD/methylene tetrahydromethanopterin reductase-like flavin-dependent oxidoreductase (luciferase family)